MKKTLVIVLLGGMLMACHSDIDLKNIDPKADLEMGLAIPIGSVRAKLGDFAGKIDHLYVDSANGGVITWRDTFPDSREYHKFDMKDHISSKDLELKVYDKLDAAGLIGSNGKITGNDMPVTLQFELPLKLKDINKELGKERLDSALIENARFSSIIDTTDLPLKWEWIDHIDLVLGSSVYREKGNTKTIYTKGESGGFGKKFDTEVDDFSICLMKDRTLKIEEDSYFKYEQNVDSVVTFLVDFTFTVPSSAGQIEIPTSARFDYHLEVEFIDYKAIWGFFNPSKDMISKNVEFDLSKGWGSLSFLKNANTPFTDPQIDVQVETKIAGALRIKGNYVYVINKNNDSVYASFKGNRQRPAEVMMPYMHPDPTKPGCAIGDSIRMSVPFNKDPDKGCIDKLFANMPQKIGYDFAVDFDITETPQIRITPDTKVSINAVCTLPMKFRDSLFVDYSDTIKGVDLSKADIDSLLREVKFVDTLQTSDVNLYLTATSEIPLTVRATFKFLDEAGQTIKDPTDQSKDFNPFTEDTISIAPPRFEKNSIGTWTPVENGKTIISAALTKPELDLLPKIKTITYSVIIDNKALDYAFKQGLNEVPLTNEQKLDLKIGITAHLDAIMDLSKIGK